MCIEDIRLGRESRPSIATFNPGVGGEEIAGHSPNRITLILTPPTGGNITYAIDQIPTSGEGIVLNLGDAPVKLNIRDDGALVTAAWFAIASAGGSTVSIFETYLAKE